MSSDSFPRSEDDPFILAREKLAYGVRSRPVHVMPTRWLWLLFLGVGLGGAAGQAIGEQFDSEPPVNVVRIVTPEGSPIMECTDGECARVEQ